MTCATRSSRSHWMQEPPLPRPQYAARERHLKQSIVGPSPPLDMARATQRPCSTYFALPARSRPRRESRTARPRPSPGRRLDRRPRPAVWCTRLASRRQRRRVLAQRRRRDQTSPALAVDGREASDLGGRGGVALVAQYGPSMRRLAIFGLSAAVLVVLLAGGAGAATPTATTFAAAGRQALETLLHSWYGGDGRWRECDQAGCPVATGDWGVDSLTYALYLRWETAADSSIPPVMSALTAAASELSGPLPASFVRRLERRAAVGHDRCRSRVPGDERPDRARPCRGRVRLRGGLGRLRARRLPADPLPAAVGRDQPPEDARDRRERDQGRDPALPGDRAGRLPAVGDEPLRRGQALLPRSARTRSTPSTCSTTGRRALGCRSASSHRSTAT